MIEFTAKELDRLIHMLPETDPRTDAYHALMRSIGELAYNTETIETILGEIDMTNRGIVKVEFAPAGKVKETDVEKPADNVVDINTVKSADPTPAEEKPAPEIDLITVRKAMKAAKQRGVDIVRAVQELGGKNLTDLSPDQWPALMKKLEEDV